ncbi:glycoside hydrolase family 5 protein [Thermasporomyces composti]|jgi:aryl-phospho-beta-D-glucosidase BglC (GH1 family)|uniref:Aryl-phospho-beta-D-glucosidase BglC (GH1 family) n=1 Tax=Thermasporomyces composti TaxID=696763 RepID=A0A3D9V6T8_THECX|nr:cellulase family glycosylhydrolase [Thermasporomyces composti]REF37227.1 aryl-phospho-beta-D-glucosidase BglC (GH1 family) [Thermasporomyces composti]
MTLTRRRLLQVTSAAVGTATLSIPASTAHAVTEAASAKATFRRNAWSRMRGMTAPSSLTEADIAAFAATGGNLLRVGFSNRPLMRKEEPFDLDPGAFEQLDRILDSCERHGVRVVIDPHTFPGLRDDYTTFPDDEFWKDLRYHELAMRLWDAVASRYHDRGEVLAGYDLLNEPAVPDIHAEEGPASWNALVLDLVATIRAHDPDRPILVASAISPRRDSPLWYTRFESVNALPPPPDPNIVITPHMYAPHAFTHQGVSYPEGVAYPGEVPGEAWEGLPASVYWDSETIRRYLAPALEYQQTYQVPIFVGEFSAPRWIGDSGNRYLRDTIDWFERFGWSWAYHAWREWHGWDAELSNTDKDDLTRYPTTPRLELLKGYFRRNRRRPR